MMSYCEIRLRQLKTLEKIEKNKSMVMTAALMILHLILDFRLQMKGSDSFLRFEKSGTRK